MPLMGGADGEDGLAPLRESLLEPESGAPASADGTDEALANRRSLVLSFATLLFSIPALIGA